ncbi:UbiA-like protein EboC [Ulvibacterium sp.]|uniref:UbiA-like protein EboC n=1 Tax=Ulvibacterium sp. TaxID=2665914 RepID=UPI003BA97D33
MRTILKGYLRLARPANLPTAAADILAGIAIAGVLSNDLVGFEVISKMIFLVFASVFLYAGGVVLNDVFDLDLDKVERPERPIPSGLIPLRSAAIYGVVLLILGIGLAFFSGRVSGVISVVLAFFIVLYDAFSKKDGFLGPMNMGLCRGLNLILGMSIMGGAAQWWYAIIPLVYIFAITVISRGEVHGNNKNHIIWAGVLYNLVILAVITLIMSQTDNILQAVPFLALFAFLVFRPLIRAYRINSPENIKKAVIAGVLSLIVLDASLAVGFSVWWYGLLLLLLLPLSIFLSKLFAVT